MHRSVPHMLMEHLLLQSSSRKITTKTCMFAGRLQEKGVGNDAEWLSILRQPLFARAGDDASASLVHLTDIFVERQCLLWKARPPLEGFPLAPYLSSVIISCSVLAYAAAKLSTGPCPAWCCP